MTLQIGEIRTNLNKKRSKYYLAKDYNIIKMKNTELEKIHNNSLIPKRLNDLVAEVLDEDPAYVADELVELSEEILLQLSAIGMSVYLDQSNQKDVFNDFIIDLFTTKSHSYNAGPLFKWTAHMIKDLKGMKLV